MNIGENMKIAIMTCVLAALVGCASQPMTPEQAARFNRQMELQRQQNDAIAKQNMQILQPPRTTSGVTATWTGRSQAGQSVTGLPGTNCEYMFGASTFWRFIQGPCTPTVQVQ